jgi:hypothetical protein
MEGMFTDPRTRTFLVTKLTRLEEITTGTIQIFLIFLLIGWEVPGVAPRQRILTTRTNLKGILRILRIEIL